MKNEIESKYGIVREEPDDYWFITVVVDVNETLEKALATATGKNIVHVERFKNGIKLG